jgi:hypothetical protein
MQVTTTIHELESEYETLMYGGPAGTQAGAVFTAHTTASTFYSQVGG